MPTTDDIMDQRFADLAALCEAHGLDPFTLATTPEPSGLVDWFCRGGLSSEAFVSRVKALTLPGE